MNIQYNLDFLIAALVLLTLLLFHSHGRKRLLDINSLIFRGFILVGIVDVLFDIICTVLIQKHDPGMNGTLSSALTVFYLMQILFPYAFLCYTCSLRMGIGERIRKTLCFWAVPSCAMALLVVTNPWHKLVFYFDGLGGYHGGPLYMVTYIYVLVYAVYAAVDTFLHRKELGERKIRIIAWFLAVAGSCVAIQAIQPMLLMTGFGLALGIAILYLTINNPSEYEDSLTGALDNQYFGQWMQEQMNRGKQWHLLTVDLREMKRINKIYGGTIGDALLQKVVEGLHEITGSDYVFRLTGKRFLMLTRSLEGYERKRNALQQFFEKGFWIDGEFLRPEVVICGIRDSGQLKKSDALLVYIEYLVSLAPDGESSIMIQSDDKTLKGFWYEQEVEHFLSTAIEQDLFEVYFQPVYSVRNKKYRTLEALSRLRHPSLGPISPEIFVGIAEKSGKITDLGYLQFRKVCQFAKDHPYLIDTIENIKINLSPMELLKEGHCQRLVQVLEEYGLPGSFFQVEITETVATEYSENMYQAITCFEKAGVGLCMDDFGAGYANLNTVLKFPFKVVKLDRSLLEGICEQEQKATFYRSIVSILQDVGYYVVSEGVETVEQLDRLTEWGVDMVQGYYFSPPVSADKILVLLGGM